MKTWVLIISGLAVIYNGFAQSQSDKDSNGNELKLNSLFLYGGYPELSYERALGKKSAVGISVGAFIGSTSSNYAREILTSDIAFLPYYRYYFGKRSSQGFFLEANANIFSREDNFDETQKWGYGLGFGVGTKFVVKNSWSIGLVAGGGSNIVQEPCGNSYACFPDVYPRLGIMLGKRF